MAGFPGSTGEKYVDTIRFRPSISAKLFAWNVSSSLCLPRYIFQRGYYYIYLGVHEGGWITRRKGVVSHELLRFRRACSRFFHRFIRISSLLTRLLRLLSFLNLLLTGFRDVSIRCIIYAIPCSRHDFSRIVLQDLVNWSTITCAILDFSGIIFDEYIVVRRKFENFENRILDNSLKVGGCDGWVGLWKSIVFFYSFEKFVGECSLVRFK